MALLIVDTQQTDEFQRIFNMFDTSGNGQLTKREIKDALEVLGAQIAPDDAQALLGRVEAEGSVGPAAFVEWMSGRKDFDIGQDLRWIFDLIDVDGSGTISRDEFAELARCLSKGKTPEEVDAAVKKIDRDGNGVVSFAEFANSPTWWSDFGITLASLRAFKKILAQYAKVAKIEGIGLVEVDSELGAGTRGASMGIAAMKTAALRKQSARLMAENGILSLDPLRVQTENNALFKKQAFRYAKYIDKLEQVLGRTADSVAETLERGAFPVVLAGDHSTAAGTIAGIKKAFPDRRLGVVWIDAHADIHSPYTTPSGNMHGMPVAVASSTDNLAKRVNEPSEETIAHWERCKALGAPGPNIRLDDLVYVSVRDTESPEDHLIESLGIPNFKTADVRTYGPLAIAEKCLAKLQGVDLIYVTFDVDSMDSAISMGTGTPVPNGLTVAEARMLNEALCKDPRVCCWEMCEINPVLDTLNTMAETSLGIFEAVVDVISARLAKKA
ncbi:MAG TPA: arginase family protein [Polyangium sp.]|nr:arginase family protein [Polyangium sp.]